MSGPDHVPTPAEQTTAHLERVVAVVLRVGVVLSCALMAAGAMITLADRGTRAQAAAALPPLRHGAQHLARWPEYRSIGAVLAALPHRLGPALVMLGVLLLIATPVLRVAVSIGGFVLERDRRFVVITTLVLGVLLASFAIG
ncbi:MAG: DUF1634 domain-containing protein [Acidimicrobiales bacterium]